MTDTTQRSVAWLVESEPGGLWWDGRFISRGIDPRFFTRDPNEAVRFARREDAEKVAASSSAMKATEHVWMAAAQPQQAATTNDLTELDHVMCLCQDCNRRSMDAERFRWLTEDHGDPETRAKCRELLGRMGVMSYSAACGAINRAIADDLKRSMLRTADQWRAAQPQQATGGET